MPRNGRHKKAVRRRMVTTEESYATASRRLARAASTARADIETPVQVDLEFQDERYPTALHVIFFDLLGPQQCRVWLDVEHRLAGVAIDTFASPPVPVWRGQALCIPIPCLTAADTNRLLKDIQPLLGRVAAGTTIDCHPNTVAKLDGDAQDAYRKIEEIVGTYPPIVVIPAKDVVLSAAEGITAATTDADLDRIARELRERVSIANGGRGYVDGLDDCLRSLRDEAARR